MYNKSTKLHMRKQMKKNSGNTVKGQMTCYMGYLWENQSTEVSAFHPTSSCDQNFAPVSFEVNIRAGGEISSMKCDFLHIKKDDQKCKLLLHHGKL